MRLSVVSVGRDRSGLFQPAVEEYARRVRRHLPLDLVELPASKSREADRSRREEADRILGGLAPDAVLVALDGGGRGWSSPRFADWMADRLQEGRDVVFAIGGDEGLDASVRTRAQVVMSLGPMTLPHRLARVVLMEQLYRAFAILRNEPYHK